MIDDTIKEIIESVIQFNADIESNNPAGLAKFLNDFAPLLVRFKTLIKNSDIDLTDYYEEFAGLFGYLFTMGKIFDIAKTQINDSIKGTIFAIKKNGNPLTWNLKSSPDIDPFKDFIKKYQGRDNQKTEPSKTAIYALLYRITYIAHPAKEFDYTPGEKIKRIKKIAIDNGISEKSFQQHYNKLKNLTASEIPTKRRYPIIKKVVDLIIDDPEALELAKGFLKQAELKI